MNIGRRYLLVAAFWLLGVTSHVFAEKRLPDSSFEDWTAVVNELALTDGSVLFDYTARTFSGRTEGAMLSMSFVPRFSCSPMLNLRLKNAEKSARGDVTLEINVGSERLQFGGLMDKDGGFVSYTVEASTEETRQLRELIDASARIRFSLSPAANEAQSQSDADSNDSVVFSLLGSRLAMLSAESHCKAHVPLAFNPQ